MSTEEMDFPEMENEEIMNDDQELPVDESAEPSGKYDKLLGEGSHKFKLSGMFKDWFLDYSSYVILDRAVPHIVDGLKPVQRRVLHAMWCMDDGNLTKVANIVGQAMQYHPHGDSSILGALVQMGQKELLIDCQGNWGNIITGDSNAAPRYIEARLSKFAKEVVFSPKITNWMTSYDGRKQEPVELPIKFPLLLAQGAYGIAVGLASNILPHNFNELLDASVAILEDKPFELYPDFPTGGYADCTKYNKGTRGGTVKVRAKIEKIDKNTLAIKEVPYGKTTQMVIDSIIKARDKGKIKIKKVDDLTTKEANILIHLANDVSPDKTIDALYAVTDCEISLNPNTCVIVEGKPQFMSVDDVLRYSTFHTRDLLGQELQLKLDELENDWHFSSLEKIFFEERVYKVLEQDSRTWEDQLAEVFSKMKEYQHLFRREIVMEDINRLVEKPVRKISKFDVKAVEEKIAEIDKQMEDIRNDIEHLTDYTIAYFKNLKKKYGKNFPRRTEITSIESIAVTRVVSNNAKLYANKAEGFVGINLKKEDNPEFICDCSDMSEIIVFRKDGKYMVTKVSDKAFLGKDIIHVGIFNRGDQRMTYNVIYREGKTSISYAKRFSVTSITKDKEYDVTQGTPGSAILYFTANGNAEAECVKIYFRPRPKLKKNIDEYDFSALAIKSRTARGNLVSKNAIQRIQLKSKGISTIGGKDIWFDEDVQRLNEDGRGTLLGQFNTGDHVLAIFKDGTYYTTSFDLSSRYQGEILKICKFDPNKVYSVLYYDKALGAFYIKRFSFEVSDNTPVSFIGDAKGSYLVAISDDKYPQMKVIFGGKYEHREAELIDVAEYIAKKSLAAKGKKAHQYDLKAVEFAEPLEKEDEQVPQQPSEAENLAGDIDNTGVEDSADDQEYEMPTLF